jgi:hypothetical protein
MLLMHETTYQYLSRQINNGRKPNYKVGISGSDFSVFGHEIRIDNNLAPTIDEPQSWIFPEEPFIIYEPKDEEWCRYAGIGRPGRGIIIGDILEVRHKPTFLKTKVEFF